MTTFSTTQAAQRFAAVLEEAQRHPVIIERHGQARAAVVSMRRFEIYEALIWKELDQMAAESFHESLDAIGEGRLTTAAQLRMKALSLAGLGE